MNRQEQPGIYGARLALEPRSSKNGQGNSWPLQGKQNSYPFARSTESEILGYDPSACVLASPLGNSGGCYGVRTTNLKALRFLAGSGEDGVMH